MCRGTARQGVERAGAVSNVKAGMGADGMDCKGAVRYGAAGVAKERRGKEHSVVDW